MKKNFPYGFLRVKHLGGLQASRHYQPGVPHLAARLGVKRGFIKHRVALSAF